MILIISKKNDRTTIEVMKCLSTMQKQYIFVQEDEVFEIRIQKKRLYLESQRNTFFIDEIGSVWYRRGGIQFLRKTYENPSIHIHMNEHQHWLEDYVMHLLESKKHINKQRKSHVNKLLVLEEARKIGLEVPSFHLAEDMDDVIIGETITKSITGNVIIESLDAEIDGIMYTSVINKRDSESFLISFFQEKIEKDFEIRSFYLNEKIWSMAIFSQNDEQTQTDFRRYNLDKPNRNVRYKLPEDIEQKMRLLMSRLDLNCGSFDFIKNKDQYYFLEINPVGQFLGLSKICNYSLEKGIAEYL